MLKNQLIKQQFYPGVLALFFNPFYTARKGLLRYIKIFAPQLSGKLLDVGCGNRPYRKFFTNATEYIGLEIDTPGHRDIKLADAYYDGEHFPFKDGEFDSVFASQVFEHVFNPDIFLTEINRVMRRGGVMLMTVPFMWDEHEQPHDFGRYTSFGLRSILEKNGFEIIEQHKSMHDIRALAQMLSGYVYKKTASWRRRHFDLLVTLLFIAPITIVGECLNLILPSNSDLYLDNIVLVKKR